MIGVLAHQMRFDVRSQLRNPPVVFFSLALPIIFLLILATLFGDEDGGATVGFLIPGITALGIISTTFVNLAIGMTIQRDGGRLKRLRATPLPFSVFMFGRVGVQVTFAFLIAAVLVLIGTVVFGVRFGASSIAPTALVVAVGAAAFACLGIALSAAIPNGDAAPAIANLVALPLYFISGVFFPVSSAPAWLNAIANMFPVKHLAAALTAALNGSGPAWIELAIVAGWGLGGALLALRFFRWSPTS